MDADHLGSEWKALARRVGFGISGITNAALALSAISIVVGTAAASGKADGSTRDWTAYLLAAPFGQWLVGAVGLIVFGVGVGIGIKGWKGSFQDRLAIDDATRRWVLPMGRIGFLARGLVFGIIGTFLVLAAMHANAGEARGLAGALRAIQQQPYGWALLGLTALGLFAFGTFQFVVAYYRRIDAPSVGSAAHAVGQQAEMALRSMRP